MTRAAQVVYLVQDLFFAARIEEAAAQLGLAAVRAADAAALSSAAPGARLLILDLRRPDALHALEQLATDPRAAEVRTVGFIDHENVAAMEAARARGCGTVLSKRKFSSELPALLAGSQP